MAKKNTIKKQEKKDDDGGTTPGAHKAHCAKGNYPLYVPGKTVVPGRKSYVQKRCLCSKRKRRKIQNFQRSFKRRIGKTP